MQQWTAGAALRVLNPHEDALHAWVRRVHMNAHMHAYNSDYARSAFL